MEPAAASALYAAENLLSGAAALFKGIAHPTLPLKATLTHITSVPLPRSYHTISVVKGRAYIFGGESSPGTLADNDMHIVILPSSGVLEADYTTIKAKPQNADGVVPGPRKGHTSVVIGDNIYVFGGEGVENEKGRIWIFQTLSHTWSYLDPEPETPAPAHRTGHAAASSELPGPKNITFSERAPQKPADPSKVVPEPADPDSWGTVFVIGGKDLQTGETLKDALAFDVRTRTWSNIPTPSGDTLEGASLGLVGDRLYRFGGKTDGNATATTEWLDVSAVWTHAEGGTTPLASGWAWQDISAPAPTPSQSTSTAASPTPTAIKVPSPRFNAGLIPVTTGQGRHYLLLLGGSSPAPSSNVTLLDDIWAFQLAPEKGSAAATKDNIRDKLKLDTHEAQWAEVRYSYVDGKGDVEKRDEEGFVKGVGPRNGFAVSRGSEVDGCGLVVWGGVDAEGRILGDGYLVSVER
ncbi:hypothetical protein CC80DRAFT_514035 [Byssothecium circinans]|uniref:Galactose oxidase n=1 Tax=Byssothecium circinans TaxID=147558 RepID=A0A6A5U6M6_9PLEO|nr:hypothetical protein CC80DRAFT_514035 [Byssothecium circinans]